MRNWRSTRNMFLSENSSDVRSVKKSHGSLSANKSCASVRSARIFSTTSEADNTGVEYPRLGTLDTQISNNQQPSSWWLRNAGFLRFKTLEIGYSFPHCRVYLSGDNIAVWSPFRYWDPELQFYSYPLQRTFNIGVQVNF